MSRISSESQWYFGWNIVAAAATLTLLTVGLRMGIGPFFLPITKSLGFSRSLLSGIIAIGMLFYGLGMPLAGYLVARFGTRFVLLLGTVIVVASVIWTVNAHAPLSFFLAFGIFLSIGLAFVSPVALTPVLSRWFVRQRGMALFFLSTGSMAGIAVVTPLFTWSIGMFGWQSTLIGYAVVFALLAIPTTLFVVREDAPEQADLPPSRQSAATTDRPTSAESRATAPSLTLREAMATRPFWKITLGLFACGYSMNLLGTHGVPMLVDHGFDATTSSLGIGMIGLVAIFSTLILGRISDILPRKHILSAIFFVRGLGFIGLLIAGTQWQLYTVAAVGGIVWAGSVALSSAILADVYGVRLVGVLYGTSYLGHQIGGMISSWLGGWGYETFGTHWLAFGSAAVFLFIAGGVALILPRQGYCLPARQAAA